MNRTLAALMLLALALAAGCANRGAIFVTKTSLAIADLDTTPAEATFAMHRIEGFIAPRNRNGDTPPVVAQMQSNRAFFKPEIRQMYATGTAAQRIAGDMTGSNSDCPKGSCTHDESTPLVFTTSTTVGLRIGFGTTANVVEGFTLGYRRKEMSFVPVLAVDNEGSYRYPSLLAVIRLSGETEKRDFRSCQGFATGSAATDFASNKRDKGFGCSDDEAGDNSVANKLAGIHDTVAAQHAESARVLACYVAVPHGRRPEVWAHAGELALLSGSAGAEHLVQTTGLAFNQLAAEHRDVLAKLAGNATATVGDTGSQYALRLMSGSGEAYAKGSSRLRELALRLHREFVCDAANKVTAADTATRP